MNDHRKAVRCAALWLAAVAWAAAVFLLSAQTGAESANLSGRLQHRRGADGGAARVFRAVARRAAGRRTALPAEKRRAQMRALYGLYDIGIFGRVGAFTGQAAHIGAERGFSRRFSSPAPTRPATKFTKYGSAGAARRRPTC